MQWRWLLIFSCGTAYASGIYNPGTGAGGRITLPLPAGSTTYVQNASTPTISTQKFNVLQGKYSVLGFRMTDGSRKWDVTISTTGALVSR